MAEQSTSQSRIYAVAEDGTQYCGIGGTVIIKVVNDEIELSELGHDDLAAMEQSSGLEFQIAWDNASSLGTLFLEKFSDPTQFKNLVSLMTVE